MWARKRRTNFKERTESPFSPPPVREGKTRLLKPFSSHYISFSKLLPSIGPPLTFHLCRGCGVETKQETLLSFVNIVSDASTPVEASVCDMFLDEDRIWSPHLAARMGELPGVMWLQVNFSGHQFAYVGKANLDIVLSVNTHFLTMSLERHNLQFSSVQSLSPVWLFTTPWTAAC